MTKDVPLVSVVAPAFRAAAFIGGMIESVLAQSMGDLELVICDDASDDDTATVVSRYSDPRVRLVRSQQNLGPGQARDRAIAVARGTWLAVIDADDAWRPRRLETLLAAAGRDTKVMVFDDVMICHHSSNGALIPWKRLRGRHAFGADADPADVSLPEYIRSSRLLIKPLIPAGIVRESGIRHSDRRFAEDAEFFIRLGMEGVRMRYVPEALYLYRSMPGSATDKAAGHHLMRECIEACAQQPSATPEVRRALEEKSHALKRHEAVHALATSLRRGRLLDALKALARRPSLAALGAPLLIRRLSGAAHRWLHGGQGR